MVYIFKIIKTSFRTLRYVTACTIDSLLANNYAETGDSIIRRAVTSSALNHGPVKVILFNALAGSDVIEG
jgi:hypothetical protein